MRLAGRLYRYSILITRRLFVQVPRTLKTGAGTCNDQCYMQNQTRARLTFFCEAGVAATREKQDCLMESTSEGRAAAAGFLAEINISSSSDTSAMVGKLISSSETSSETSSHRLSHSQSRNSRFHSLSHGLVPFIRNDSGPQHDMIRLGCKFCVHRVLHSSEQDGYGGSTIQALQYNEVP